MQNLGKLLVVLAVVALAMAVIEVVFPQVRIFGDPESYSRLSNNLALIGIAMVVCFRDLSKSEE